MMAISELPSPMLLMLLSAATFTDSTITFRNLFVRIPNMRLMALPMKVMFNMTVDNCADCCVYEVEFESKSFDVENINKECHLHNHSNNEPLFKLQEAHSVDHYRTAYEKLFNRLPNHYLTTQHQHRVAAISTEECARRCILKMAFKCRGFDYENNLRNCWLTDKTPSDVDGVKVRPDADYYKRIGDHCSVCVLCVEIIPEKESISKIERMTNWRFEAKGRARHHSDYIAHKHNHRWKHSLFCKRRNIISIAAGAILPGADPANSYEIGMVDIEINPVTSYWTIGEDNIVGPRTIGDKTDAPKSPDVGSKSRQIKHNNPSDKPNEICLQSCENAYLHPI